MDRRTSFSVLAAAAYGVAVGATLFLLSACSSNMNGPVITGSSDPNQASALDKHGAPATMQVNLVADAGGYSAARIDESLKNAWGIAQTPTGRIWISANHSGVSVIYDQAGNSLRAPVTIPTKDSSHGGAPTGVIFNPTTGFVIPQTGEVSKFIFAGEDGIISAWSSGAAAMVVADRTPADAVYKGLTLASNGGRWYIYAANFKGKSVDVFDSQFHYDSTITFVDASMPSDFAPFNVQSIDGILYVTYAKPKGPDFEDDDPAPGNGYVDQFRPDGTLIRRFASQGSLNSPWGITEGPRHGAENLGDKILIGNFGDGRINIFDEHGKFAGQLSDSAGAALTIPGLWGLMFSPGDDDQFQVKHPGGPRGVDARNDSTRIFFTAGPNGEDDGLFGYLMIARGKPKPDSAPPRRGLGELKRDGPDSTGHHHPGDDGERDGR